MKGIKINMVKNDLVKEISLRTGLTKKDVETVITAFPEVVKETVAKGEDVKLTGFLTFAKKHVDAKTGKSKLGGVEKSWATEAKDEISVKISKSYKELA